MTWGWPEARGELSTLPDRVVARQQVFSRPARRQLWLLPAVIVALVMTLLGGCASGPALKTRGDSQTGTASYYGDKFHGRTTANGERFDMHAMTAAHPNLPFDTRVKVTHLGNGRAVVVRINDRGPFVHGRIIDLSKAAASKLGMIRSGLAEVRVERLSR